MIVNWTVEYELDFDESYIKSIVTHAQQENWSDGTIYTIINAYIEDRYDTETFYAWGIEQAEVILKEVKRRMGGVQISMFDKENENEN